MKKILVIDKLLLDRVNQPEYWNFHSNIVKDPLEIIRAINTFDPSAIKVDTNYCHNWFSNCIRMINDGLYTHIQIGQEHFNFNSADNKLTPLYSENHA